VVLNRRPFQADEYGVAPAQTPIQNRKGLTALDRQLVAALMAESRCTLAKTAQKQHWSLSLVKYHMNKLRKKGAVSCTGTRHNGTWGVNMPPAAGKKDEG